MRRFYKSFICLLICLSFLLCGCDSALIQELLGNPLNRPIASQMSYTRPDPQALEEALEQACQGVDSNNAFEALNAVFTYYDAYDSFSTNSALAYIYYCQNTSDTYWQEEYAYCLEVSPVLDATITSLYEYLAHSQHRQKLEALYFGEGYFDYYINGDNIDWTDALLALIDEESALIDQYYSLTQETVIADQYSNAYFSQYFEPLTEVFVQLIRVRQQIAREAGYSDYASFAYDYYHTRSYTPRQAEDYLLMLQELMVPLYLQLPETPPPALYYSGAQRTFQYVKDSATAMGGIAEEAFLFMEENKLYDIKFRPNKSPVSFETYLWSYSAPYVFVSPRLNDTDHLSFAHEFGHFINDYAGGSNVGTDIAEIHSQGFEYLSLCYGYENPELTRFRLGDSLSIYVEQAAFALFELRAYALTDDQLTTENVAQLYRDICTEFGFSKTSWDPRDLITIPHFYTNPMYVFSYVVSNDLAMQLYGMELEESGAGLELYEQLFQQQTPDIHTFVNTYGVADPLSETRAEEAAALLKNGLFS